MISIDYPALITSFVLPTVTLIETLVAPLIIYLALYHSKQMKRFRFLIINNVASSCLFNWALYLLQPVFMYPTTCIITYRSFLHAPYLTRNLLNLFVILFVKVGLAVVWELHYRFFMVFPGVLSDLAESSKGAIIFVALFEVVSFVLAINPVELFNIPDPEQDRQYFIEQLPELRELEPVLGYACKATTAANQAWGVIGFGVMMVLFLYGVVMEFIIYFRVTYYLPRITSMTNSIRMQRMLFTALTAQFIVSCIFLLFPTALITLTAGSASPDGRTIFAICLTLVQLHGCIDFIAMIYFITPYRRKVMGIMGGRRSVFVNPISTTSGKRTLA